MCCGFQGLSGWICSLSGAAARFDLVVDLLVSGSVSTDSRFLLVPARNVDNCDTQLGGYSVVLTNDVGHFQLILTRNFMRANQNRLSAERAESNVPVAIRFPEGAVREYRPRGTGNKQSRSVSHDVITIQEIDGSVVRRLLGTRSNIEVTYSGRHGSETFTIRPNTWVALSEGFGQYCMG